MTPHELHKRRQSMSGREGLLADAKAKIVHTEVDAIEEISIF